MQKKYAKARLIYENLLSKEPHRVNLYITLANIYINENRIDEISVRIFEKAIQYDNGMKFQLEPIVSKYYLDKPKFSDNSTKLLDEALQDKLNNMGN